MRYRASVEIVGLSVIGGGGGCRCERRGWICGFVGNLLTVNSSTMERLSGFFWICSSW